MVVLNHLMASFGSVMGNLDRYISSFFNFIYIGIYYVFICVTKVVTFAEMLFKKLAGIDTPQYDASFDVVNIFLKNEVIRNLFFQILAVSIVLLIIFTIVALIKSEFHITYAKTKSAIIGRALKSIANFFVIPLIFFAGMIATQTLARLTYSVTGGDSLPLMTRCFKLATYEANRMRLSNGESFKKFLADKAFINNDNSRLSFSTPEEIDNLFLYPIADGGGETQKYKYSSLMFNKYDIDEKAKMEQDMNSGGYADWQTLIIGYPDNTTRHPMWNATLVNYFYEMREIDYVLGIGSAIIIGYNMLIMCLLLVKRAFELVILFLLSPIATAVAPIKGDDGEKQLQKEFTSRLLSIIGPIFAYGVFFALLNVYTELDPFGTGKLGSNSEAAFNTALAHSENGIYVVLTDPLRMTYNVFFEVIGIFVGTSLIKSSSALLSSVLGIQDLVGEVDKMSKAAFDTVTKAATPALLAGKTSIGALGSIPKGIASSIKSTSYLAAGGKGRDKVKKERAMYDELSLLREKRDNASTHAERERYKEDISKKKSEIKDFHSTLNRRERTALYGNRTTRWAKDGLQRPNYVTRKIYNSSGYKNFTKLGAGMLAGNAPAKTWFESATGKSRIESDSKHMDELQKSIAEDNKKIANERKENENKEKSQKEAAEKLDLENKNMMYEFINRQNDRQDDTLLYNHQLHQLENSKLDAQERETIEKSMKKSRATNGSFRGVNISMDDLYSIMSKGEKADGSTPSSQEEQLARELLQDLDKERRG